ncbi:MAG: RIP metalloprotease RseP [Nitrospinae bacterium]|nr:RIP metalloprotease RseP [Nitrospinota bacterium]
MFELSVIPFDAIAAFSGKMLVFLAGLAALIFVHELGHFLAARRCGVVVEKFSLGFGPKIFGKTYGETEYVISAIPLGGYVKMKGEDPDEAGSEEGSFSAAPVKDRLIIAFAGPLFNILFAVVIYIFVYMVGVETLAPVVGTVKDNSPAQAAGLQTGDQILAIQGEPIRFWEDLQDRVHNSPGQALDFRVERQSGKILNVNITPISEEIKDLFGDKKQVGLIGIAPMVHTVTYVKKGTAAERAGIQLNDRIIAVGATPIFGWSDLKDAAIDHPGEELTFLIRRDGIEILVPLTPTPIKGKDKDGKEIEIGEIGIGMSGRLVLEQYGPFGAFLRSLEETWRLTYLIAVSVKKMIFGSISADNIGGPILIFQIYGEQAEQGFHELIRLTALLSINLGLLNLLPIPVLDGGHILFFLIEIIKGRPVSEKNRERAQQVGIFMLLSLMVFAFYNDIVRIIN